MTALLILACSATKRPDAGLLPALERYDGPAFRVLRKALRERPGLLCELCIRILSAEHGLIPPNVLIPDYDRRMTPGRAMELYMSVQHGINDVRGRYTPTRIFVSGGRDYRLALPPLPSTVEWATGGQGTRLGLLKRWLEQLELDL